MECSICISEVQDPVFTPCIHGFCRKCITGWIKENESKNRIPCPLCKHDISSLMENTALMENSVSNMPEDSIIEEVEVLNNNFPISSDDQALWRRIVNSRNNVNRNDENTAAAMQRVHEILSRSGPQNMTISLSDVSIPSPRNTNPLFEIPDNYISVEENVDVDYIPELVPILRTPRNAQLHAREDALRIREFRVEVRERRVDRREALAALREIDLNNREASLTDRERTIIQRETELNAREQRINIREIDANRNTGYYARNTNFLPVNNNGGLRHRSPLAIVDPESREVR